MALDEKQNIYNAELKELLEIIQEDTRPVITRLTKIVEIQCKFPQLILR